MDIYGALFDVDGAPPDPIEELFPVKGPLRMTHQKFEEAELRRANVNVVLAHGEAVALRIEHERAEDQLPGLRGPGAPEHGLNAGDELPGRRAW